MFPILNWIIYMQVNVTRTRVVMTVSVQKTSSAISVSVPLGIMDKTVP